MVAEQMLLNTSYQLVLYRSDIELFSNIPHHQEEPVPTFILLREAINMTDTWKRFISKSG